MAGHPLLNQVRSKSEVIVIDGDEYNIFLSYNHIAGIDGFIVGVKFTDSSGSMDSSKAKSIPNPFRLANAISYRIVQMVRPDLDNVSILGFYLLTEDLDARRIGGGKIKRRIYGTSAALMHKEVKQKLQYLTMFEVEGGVGWALSKTQYTAYEQFHIFQNELAKQMRISIC